MLINIISHTVGCDSTESKLAEGFAGPCVSVCALAAAEAGEGSGELETGLVRRRLP
eukprot:COSAG02_NODE_14637_length_1252_cov_1.247181_1_plen_55_part_10